MKEYLGSGWMRETYMSMREESWVCGDAASDVWSLGDGKAFDTVGLAFTIGWGRLRRSEWNWASVRDA